MASFMVDMIHIVFVLAVSRQGESTVSVECLTSFMAAKRNLLRLVLASDRGSDFCSYLQVIH